MFVCDFDCHHLRLNHNEDAQVQIAKVEQQGTFGSTVLSDLTPYTPYVCCAVYFCVNVSKSIVCLHCCRYMILVRLHTDDIEGEWSAVASATTAETVPSKMNSPSIVELSSDTVLVSWLAPNPLPGAILRYEVVSSGTVVYSGKETSAVVASSYSQYQVRAVTSAGSGELSEPASVASSSSSQSSPSVASQPEFYAPVVVITLALLVVAVVAVRRYKTSAENVLVDFVKPVPDEWEMDPSRIKIGAKLGEGAFGIVMAATATNAYPEKPGVAHVAVKMCMPTATAVDKRDFLAEANLMKKFARPHHPNVCVLCCGREST